MKRTDEKILQALAAGCTLHDVYEAGYKYRRAFYWQYVQNPDGSNKKTVSKCAVHRLESAGMIEASEPRGPWGVNHKITLSLTVAGAERAAALPCLDLDKHFAEKPVYLKPAVRALLERIRTGVDASADGWFDLIADGSKESIYTFTLWRMRDLGFVAERPGRKFYGSSYFWTITDAGRAYLDAKLKVAKFA
ncbi:hypothetical protein [Bradyrhizobium sp. CCBAU 45384]|uniref:hypothetical protein n=1 Tax=Bradyrhizobium sp. CCBAU 45384 TaxID=858428 RepID=UPI002306A2AD|nr:hypothetical protein [Bradyrhizobium sp. CCBAU 45384]MDA9411872.1 hypothetical protein [Bradyrhizobium sp. CCBAU 45384]